MTVEAHRRANKEWIALLERSGKPIIEEDASVEEIVRLIRDDRVLGLSVSRGMESGSVFVQRIDPDGPANWLQSSKSKGDRSQHFGYCFLVFPRPLVLSAEQLGAIQLNLWESWSEVPGMH